MVTVALLVQATVMDPIAKLAANMDIVVAAGKEAKREQCTREQRQGAMRVFGRILIMIDHRCGGELRLLRH